MARTELKSLKKEPVASIEAAPRKLEEDMPKIGLKPVVEPKVEAIVEAKIVPTTTEIVVREEAPLVINAAPSFILGQITGPVDSSDIYRPRLELSQSVGPLMDAGFAPGQIVLAKETAIWAEDYEPLKLTLLASRKQFIEDVPYGSGQEQRTFNSPVEVKAANLWTEWHDQTPPPVFPRLTCVALIQKPEYVEDDTHFGIDLLGNLYAIAEVRWDGAAYSRAAKTVMTAGSGILAKGLHRGSWNYSCERAKLKVNTVTVPIMKFAGLHNEEFVKALADLAW